MSVPELVRDRLAGEEVAARVSLGGDDQLVVTPSRTLVYRGEGLLSGESVEAHSHDAERIFVTDGRRKSTIRLDHGIDGESEFTIPKDRLDEALAPVFGGVLRSAGVLDEEETVTQIYRLGELTLALTDSRVVKHIGGALWDEEYEEYAYEDVTGLDVERGDVSSQIIVEVAGRPQRIKTPSEKALEVRERIERALLTYHEVGSYQELVAKVAPEEEGDEAQVSATGTDEAAEAAGVEDGGEETVSALDDTELMFENTDSVGVDDPGAPEPGAESEVAAEVAEIRAAIERHSELIERQQQLLETLVEELRRGR